MNVLAVIGQLLSIGIAVALSTVPITVTITILLSPTASRSALAFLIGWLIGMFLVAGAFALGLHGISLPANSDTQLLVGIAELLIGLALIVYGLRMLIRHSGTPSTTELPRALRMVESIKPAPAFGLAVLLNLRPKALLLAAAAGLVTGGSGLELWQDTIALVVYVVLGASTVAVPIIFCLARPDRARPPLQRAKAWISRNNRTVTFVVAVVVGTVIFGDGLGRL